MVANHWPLVRNGSSSWRPWRHIRLVFWSEIIRDCVQRIQTLSQLRVVHVYSFEVMLETVEETGDESGEVEAVDDAVFLASIHKVPIARETLCGSTLGRCGQGGQEWRRMSLISS